MKNIVVAIMLLSVCSGTLMVPLVYLDFTLRQDYIIEVLCENRDEPITVCYGSCYLEKQLDKATDQQEQQNRTINQKPGFIFFNQPIPVHHLSPKAIDISKQYTEYQPQAIPTSPLDDIFRPPRMV